MKLLLSYKAQSVTLLLLWIVAMVFSAEFILSQVMILLMAFAVFQLKIEGQRVRIQFREGLVNNLRKTFTNPVYLAVMIPFFVVLLTAFWSVDLDYTFERLRIKLPFLLLPFAFVSMPKFKEREVFVVLYFLVLVMFVACLYVGWNYLTHFDAVNEMIGKGKPMPTPSNHIRFSLMLGLAILAGAALYYRGFFLRYAWEKQLVAGITLFLFAFIHILSVRSGLLVLYLAILFLCIRYVYLTRRFAVGALVAFCLASLPVIAYQTIPSFKTKINYAHWDFMQYLQGKGANYSDSERLTSVEVGLKIGNQHPILGVGAGDLKKEVKKVYASEYRSIEKPKMPHNQFVSLYAGAGLFGLLVFLLGFFFPLFFQKNYLNPLFFAFHIMIFFSFMMENTIENNFGVSMYLLFLLIGLKYLNRQPEALTTSNSPVIAEAS